MLQVATDKVNCLAKISKCYEKQNNSEAALKTLDYMREQDTRNSIPYYKLGKFHLRQGDIKLGIDNLLKSHSLDAKNLECLLKLGESYLLLEGEENCYDEALKYLQEALVIDPDNYNALIGIGNSYEKKNQIEEAIKYTLKVSFFIILLLIIIQAT